jgi:hypothetical protein
MNSTRAAGGSTKCVTGCGLPGCVPSCEFTGTPSMATTCIVWGLPSKTAGLDNMTRLNRTHVVRTGNGVVFVHPIKTVLHEPGCR